MTAKKIPNQLGSKLKAIREYKGFTLDEMAESLGLQSSSRRSRVYEWEQGTRQPDYPTLLIYARIAKTTTDILIDDDLDLMIGG